MHRFHPFMHIIINIEFFFNPPPTPIIQNFEDSIPPLPPFVTGGGGLLT